MTWTRVPLRGCFLANSPFVSGTGRNGRSRTAKRDAITTGYLCHEIKNCASNRLPTSIKQYAQGLAWLLQDSEIDIEHIKSVIPYTLAHRVQWKDQVLSQKERAKRDDPFPIYLAKEAVKVILQRYREQSDHLKDALAVGSKIFQGESLGASGRRPPSLPGDQKGSRTAEDISQFRLLVSVMQDGRSCELIKS